MEHAPGEGGREERAAEPCRHPEERVLHGEHARHEAARGPERLEKHALVEPLIAAHAERPRGHDQAGGDADPGEEPDGEGDLVEDGGETLEYFADGNDGNVRKGRDDRRLHAAFVFGLRARRGQIGGGGAVQGPRGKDHEEIGVEALPVHAAEIDDPRLHRQALDVEAEGAADRDAEALGDLLFHRDQGLSPGLLLGPPASRHDLVVRGRPRSPGQHVLAREIPGFLALVPRRVRDAAAIDRDQARANDRGQVGRAAGTVGHELPEGLGLIGLDVDEEERRRALRSAIDEVGAQALLEEGHGDDEHHGQTEGDQDHARVRVRTVEIGHGLAPGERAGAGEPARGVDDEPRCRAKQEQRARQPAHEERADLHGARLPEGERGQARHDGHGGQPGSTTRQSRFDIAPEDQGRRHATDIEERPEREEQRETCAHGEPGGH